MSNETTLKVLIVANKNWEAEPLVGVLAGKRPRPERLKLVAEPAFPLLLPKELARKGDAKTHASTNAMGDPRPRLRLRCDTNRYSEPTVYLEGAQVAAVTPYHLEAEVWCIEDWMTHSAFVSASSTREKWDRAFPTIRDHAFAATYGSPQTPDLVIAFGTAGMPSNEIVNGCVTIGSKVYIHDPFWDDPNARKEAEGNGVPMLDLSTLDIGAKEGVARLTRSPLKSGDVFRLIPDEVRLAAEGCFLAPPVHPAVPSRIFSGSGFSALSTINVTNYEDYIWTDDTTRKRFEDEFRQKEIGSMESTHGPIRAFWRDAAFLFVSGITDRVPLFSQEVTPRVYAQNFVCAHNAGVTVAHLLPALLDLHMVGRLRT